MDWKEVERELGDKCFLLSSRIAMKEKKGIDLCVFFKKGRDMERDDLRLRKRYHESYEIKVKYIQMHINQKRLTHINTQVHKYRGKRKLMHTHVQTT